MHKKPKPTTMAENIFPYILPHIYIYCHALPPFRLNGAPTRERENIAILWLVSFLKLQNPHHSFLLLPRPPPSKCLAPTPPCFAISRLFEHFFRRRQICLFFISFSLIPSMCPSILFLQ